MAGNAIAHSRLDIRRPFAHSLSLFIPFLAQTSLQISNRLEAFQREYNIFDDSPSKGLGNILSGVDVNGIHMQGMDGEHVVDGPIVHSRAGLYIYLNALVSMLMGSGCVRRSWSSWWDARWSATHGCWTICNCDIR